MILKIFLEIDHDPFCNIYENLQRCLKEQKQRHVEFVKPKHTVHDLENFPYPFDDNSVDEILLTHVLEHIGQSPDVFLKIINKGFTRGGISLEQP